MQNYGNVENFYIAVIALLMLSFNINYAELWKLENFYIAVIALLMLSFNINYAELWKCGELLYCCYCVVDAFL